jgi:hypothetical protein
MRATVRREHQAERQAAAPQERRRSAAGAPQERAAAAMENSRIVSFTDPVV